jgi:hypothetical protein
MGEGPNACPDSDIVRFNERAWMEIDGGRVDWHFIGPFGGKLPRA